MTCPACHGTGHPRWAKDDLCHTCKGSGKVCDGCNRPLDEHSDDGRRCEGCKRRIAEVFDAD